MIINNNYHSQYFNCSVGGLKNLNSEFRCTQSILLTIIPFMITDLICLTMFPSQILYASIPPFFQLCKENMEGKSFYAKGGKIFCKNHAVRQ